MTAMALLMGIARAAGTAGARIVRLAEMAGFAAGWGFSAPLASVSLVDLALGSAPSWQQVAKLGLSLAVMAVSLAAVGSARLLRRLGFRVSLVTASLYAFLAFALWDAAGFTVRTALATAIFLSIGLGAVTGLKNPDQVAAGIMSIRRYLNGVRRNGKPWNCFDCLSMPGVPAAALGFSLLSIFNPAPAAIWISGLVTHLQELRIGREIGHAITLPPVPAPTWVSASGTWLFLAALFALELYVALRRIGSGSPGRGLRLSLLALGEAGGALGGVASLLTAYGDGWNRVDLLVLAVFLAALAVAARQRRRAIIGIYGSYDPMFGG